MSNFSQIQQRNWQRSFRFRTVFQKRSLLLYRVFRKLSFVNQPGFFEAQKPRESRLFYFQKGAYLSAPFSSRSPVLGGRLFSFSHTIIPCLKRHRRKWRSKVKNPAQASSKPNRTRPEYRSHTGPPAQTEKPVCTASQLCEGCPFPGHGFLCQGEDGECMRTRLMKLSEK